MAVEQVMVMKWCFGIKAKIDFNKIPKILECTIRTMISAVKIFNLSNPILISIFGDLISSCLRS
jgi:hypothetical protein